MGVNCKGWTGKLFGHNYKAMYDTKEYLPAVDLEGASVVAIKAIKTYESHYVYSICKRCGCIVDR